MTVRLPALFVSHGSPTLALDERSGADFARWAHALPTPRAIVAVSAHWERTPITIGTTRDGVIVHDFSGFPESLYALRYDAPGAPELARELASSLGAILDDTRPLDHGVWVPLLHMFPRANVPVVQLSLPARESAQRLFDLGRALAPLRDQGILLMASGGSVHNLAALDWSGRGEPFLWAIAFDDWLRDVLVSHDHEALLAAPSRAPSFRLAHPTPEHFLPLLVAAGAGTPVEGPVSFPIEGFEFGSLGRRCVQFD